MTDRTPDALVEALIERLRRIWHSMGSARLESIGSLNNCLSVQFRVEERDELRAMFEDYDRLRAAAGTPEGEPACADCGYSLAGERDPERRTTSDGVDLCLRCYDKMDASRRKAPPTTATDAERHHPSCRFHACTCADEVGADRIEQESW